MKILVLDTGLFPEKQVIEQALVQLGVEHQVSRHDALAGLSDDDWDGVARAIASADRVITL